MKKYSIIICTLLVLAGCSDWLSEVCGYEYDPAVGDVDNGVAAGTAWEDVPEDWLCPLCGVGKDEFEPAE